ncbi:hypothetical protein [Massilia sp. CT11-137]|uniref:hypothetical protein n=1 Tax=Massilia sp. CT11-137 TaxID=3393901 RepID=UPI0039AFCC7B
MRKPMVLILLAFIANGVSAQQDMPLEQRQKLADIEKAVAAMNKLKAMSEEISQEKRQACLKAFGHTKFCGCLADNAPIALSFQQYISVVTHSKEENKYSTLNSENKKIYDLALTARDQCVKQFLK